MKLRDFIKEPAFSKYEKEISGYEKEFVEAGCEKFLWPAFMQQKEAMEFTKELAAKRGQIKTHPCIESFIEQLKQAGENEIIFIYPEDYSPKFLMCQEIAKKAKKSFVIKNIFAEDDTKNWVAVFEKGEAKAIGMMFYIVYSMVGFAADTFGGYKMFGRGLMYYADCLQYDGHVLGPEWPNLLAHFQGNSYRRDTNPGIILEARRVTEMIVRLGYFNDEYEIFYNMYKVLLPFLQKQYETARDYIEGRCPTAKTDIKELESQLVADGVIVSKWKSEQTLFTLVKKIYPDALFQYRPSWLEPQNLDIYIPSQNVGIEYQGIQHYESIDFFGGEEAFIHRQELDARKKRLCCENDLKLMEWPYTDEITNKKFKEKMEKFK